VTLTSGPVPQRPWDRPAPDTQNGHAEIDEAMRGLGDLSQVPVADHHDRLARVHEVLHAALHPERNA